MCLLFVIGILILIICLVFAETTRKVSTKLQNRIPVDKALSLKCVLTSCNNNPTYEEFIPYFVKAWKALFPDIRIIIVYIGDSIPDHLLKYNDFMVLFEEYDNIPTPFVSQYIRILYPAIIDCSGGILITDIDMIPLNTQYYTSNLKYVNDDQFLCYRESATISNQLPICYNIALNTTWQEIFGIYSKKDIVSRLKMVYTDSSWESDQMDLKSKVWEWHIQTQRFVTLDDDDTLFNRLDRENVSIIDSKIEQDIINLEFSDYHCLRPYSTYKDTNDKVLKLITK